jgi:hypothetical protein
MNVIYVHMHDVYMYTYTYIFIDILVDICTYRHTFLNINN